MYYLVQYTEDNILQVVPKVIVRNSRTRAKYLDNRYYDAKILTRSVSKELLISLCRNIEKNCPVVEITPLDENCIQAKDLAVEGGPSDMTILNEALRHDIIILSDTSIQVGQPDRQLSQGLPDNTYRSLESHPSDCTYNFENLSVGNTIVWTNDNKENLQPSEAGSKSKKRKASQKKHNCFFCQKQVFKIYRHYTEVHKHEPEVREIVALPIKSPYRKSLLDKIRKKGDYIFNTQLKTENDEPIVCRQTLGSKRAHQGKNRPCPNCKGYYSKYSIRHHISRCIPSRRKGRFNIQAECRKLENKIHPNASDMLRTKVFPYLNEDDVTNAIRYDEAVISYANYLCRKYPAEHNHAQIRANIRALGRFILAVKEKNGHIKNLSDVLDPAYIELIIEGIETVAGLNPESHTYKAPATAMLLSTELKKMCRLLEMECIKINDIETKKKMENLHLLFNLEFQVTVNKRGLETQKVNHRRKTHVLPKTQQIAQFRIFLEDKIRYYIKHVETKYTLKGWTHLAEYTLTHLAVFNRKRPGETQRILIEDYRHFEIADEDLSSDLDSLSAEQIKKWARIRFTGKLGKNTALLIHRELGFKAIDLILKYREEAGVHPNNMFVFGEPSQFKAQATFQACNLIRKFSFESNIENPQLLRTRLLRRHLATETARSSVDPRIEGRVSDFMSHQRQIHEDYYVMTQKEDDITKVSKLLEDFSSSRKTKLSSEMVEEIKKPKPCSDQISELTECCESESSSDDSEGHKLSQAEVNYAIGKRQYRTPWTAIEKEKARSNFYEEICGGTILSRKKVNKFFQENKCIYENRTPHLIMQWIKNQRKKFLSNEKVQKGQRQRWSTPEKEVLRSSTERHSSDSTLPSLAECELIIERNKDVLSNRTPSMVKAYVYNQTKRKSV